MLGGCSETGMPLDSVEVLDVASQTWSQLPPLPTARAGASVVAVDGQVMVLGGMNQQQTPLASVETFHPDEGKWETRASLTQPSMGVTIVEKGEKAKKTNSFFVLNTDNDDEKIWNENVSQVEMKDLLLYYICQIY